MISEGPKLHTMSEGPKLPKPRQDPPHHSGSAKPWKKRVCVVPMGAVSQRELRGVLPPPTMGGHGLHSPQLPGLSTGVKPWRSPEHSTGYARNSCLDSKSAGRDTCNADGRKTVKYVPFYINWIFASQDRGKKKKSQCSVITLNKFHSTNLHS